MLEEAIAFLLDRQGPDGGWGALSGRPADTETTSVALLALSAVSPERRADGLAAARRRGLEWLRSRQRPDGSWPPIDGVPEGSWMTALASLALAGEGGDLPAAVAGGRWLLERQGITTPWYWRILRLFTPRDRGEEPAVVLDPDLAGWPWTDETFSWVEPTSYALLALKRLAPHLPAGDAEDRIREGEAMVLDRVCPGGGWNYGSSRVLGEDLPPYPDTTAVALLALRDRREDPAIDESLATLRRMMASHDSGLSLALALLCLGAYDAPEGELRPLRDRLRDAHERNRFLEDGRVFGLAALALAGGTASLRVSA